MAAPATPAPATAGTWRPAPAMVQALVVGCSAVAAGLVTGRADVALLGAPLVFSVALALRRPAPTPPTVRVTPTGMVEQGARVALRVDVAADGAQLVAVKLPAGADVPLGETVVLAGGRRSLTCAVTVEGRGRVMLARPDWLAVGDDGVRIAGPFQGPEAVALSLPRGDRVPPGPLPPRPAGFAGGHRTRRPGEGSDLVDVRAFRPGDGVRRIDWRVSARRSPTLADLYVRRTEADADADVLLYVDTRVDVGTDAADWAAPPGRGPAGRPVPGSSLDLAVRAATSLATAQLRYGDRVGLVDLSTRRTWLRPGSGRRHLLRMRVRLAVLRSNPDASTVVLRPERLPRGAVVVLLSPLLDDAAVAVATEAARRGARVLCVDVLPDPVRADRSAPSASEALDVVLGEQARRREALAAQGIQVLRWEPAVVTAHLARWSRRPVTGARRGAR